MLHPWFGRFHARKGTGAGFYAREDMRTPVRVGIIAMVSNMALNVAFVFPLMTMFNMGHVGLALATSVTAWLNAGSYIEGYGAAACCLLQQCLSSGYCRLDSRARR